MFVVLLSEIVGFEDVFQHIPPIKKFSLFVAMFPPLSKLAEVIFEGLIVVIILLLLFTELSLLLQLNNIDTIVIKRSVFFMFYIIFLNVPLLNYFTKQICETIAICLSRGGQIP